MVRTLRIKGVALSIVMLIITDHRISLLYVRHLKAGLQLGRSTQEHKL